MVDLAIIADDLTGALDAAAPFAARGIPTVVALFPSALPKALATGARVIGVSTDSREIAPDAATKAVRLAISLLPPGTALFKKVDSRLKGNVAAELDAIEHRRSLVAPAIPEFGRITRNRQISGFGLSEPVDVRARLGIHAATAYIPDIEVPADMDRALLEPHDLDVGARGLAEAIARKMQPGLSAPGLSIAPSATYCIVGSTDPITLAQLDHMRRTIPHLTDIKARNGVAPVLAKTSEIVLIQAVPGDARVTGQSVAAELGASLLRLSPPSGSLLVISGGATAQTILQVLGIETLEVLGEIQPGLPIALGGGLTVVTKSGGFGGPDSLSRLFDPDLCEMKLLHSNDE
ncbi:four-carbon acid sugar kinase family protein [Rhodobacter sp. SY28-1]|uniref:four-carbon acid sugar kinase family protein n=1 Tax=Rhodobacter sp. SY28-1 TaxID=2562317 RepID=UPI0010C0C412|nr:four-carbon acid sugar kinase family protein [Rhodobacter sp. SY28-1]